MVEIKNRYHRQLLRELRKSAGRISLSKREFAKRYVGTKKFYYSVKMAGREKIIKNFLRNNVLSMEDLFSLLNSLFMGRSHEEVSLAGKFLEFLPRFKKELDIELLDKWLDRVEGWAETDSLCQSNFGAKNILEKWSAWKELLNRFCRDKNIHKRRASLVLLNRAVQDSSDKKLAGLALANIEKLKSEKDTLITKAISWLLRSMIKNHRKTLIVYLEKSRESLPKIALRETLNKLKTGRKNRKIN